MQSDNNDHATNGTTHVWEKRKQNYKWKNSWVKKQIFNTLYQWNNSWVRKKKRKHAIPMEQLKSEKRKHATYGTYAWVHLTDLWTTYALIKPTSMELYLTIFSCSLTCRIVRCQQVILSVYKPRYHTGFLYFKIWQSIFETAIIVAQE